MTTRPGAFAAAVVLALGTAVAGCSGADPEDETAEASFSVAGSLAELPMPEDADFFTVTVADLDAVRRANGIDVPDLADPEAVGDYAMRMTGADPDAVAVAYPPRAEQVVAPADRRAVVGFSWIAADRLASVDAPPDEFDWYAYAEPVEPSDALSDLGDGVLSDGDADDYETDVDGVDEGGDALGRSLRVGVEDEEAVVALSTDDVQHWLDGDATTLADDAGVLAVAEALDGAGVVSATLSRFAAADEGDEPTTIGIGWTVTDGQRGFVVAYDFGDDDAASAALDAVQTAYDEDRVAAELDVTAVEARGRGVVVSGRQLRQVDAPYRMLQSLTLPTTF